MGVARKGKSGRGPRVRPPEKPSPTSRQGCRPARAPERPEAETEEGLVEEEKKEEGAEWKKIRVEVRD